MKRNKVLLFTALLSAHLCIIASSVLPAQTITPPVITASGAESITPYSDDIQWRYKIMDGKLYRRQYNATKRVWIGEWELC